MKLSMKLMGDSKPTVIDLPEGTDVDDLRYKIEHQINFDLQVGDKLTTIVATHVQAFSFVE